MLEYLNVILVFYLVALLCICLIKLRAAKLMGTMFGTRLTTFSPTEDILEISIPEVLLVSVVEVASTFIAFELAIMYILLGPTCVPAVVYTFMVAGLSNVFLLKSTELGRRQANVVGRTILLYR